MWKDLAPMNNPQLLIDAIVQQTMVFIAQLATSGGIRAPLAGVADQVFTELTSELEKQGVKKKVIADMFGMALRTYHRKSQELRTSQTVEGQTLWEAVFGFLREQMRASTSQVLHRFRHDDLEMVTGVLSDLVNSGLAYRAGRGTSAMYRIADPDDFDSMDKGRAYANLYLVWLTVYRHGPLDAKSIAEVSHIDAEACQAALSELVEQGKVKRSAQGDNERFESDALDVPLGATQGWEAAVLDHFQAMTTAIIRKLSLGPTAPGAQDLIGGSTWSLDVWPGHPLESEAKQTLHRARAEMENLRERIDTFNLTAPAPTQLHRVIVYVGQDVRNDEAESSSLSFPRTQP